METSWDKCKPLSYNLETREENRQNEVEYRIVALSMGLGSKVWKT